MIRAWSNHVDNFLKFIRWPEWPEIDFNVTTPALPLEDAVRDWGGRTDGDAVTSVGTAPTAAVADGTSGLTVDMPADAESIAAPVSNVVISAGGTLELA